MFGLDVSSSGLINLSILDFEQSSPDSSKYWNLLAYCCQDIFHLQVGKLARLANSSGVVFLFILGIQTLKELYYQKVAE